ncbi:MAG: hypothetical protein PWP14_1584 [Methanolobus sp.]|nr:hypothetical protein [Methanolobus sp.]
MFDETHPEMVLEGVTDGTCRNIHHKYINVTFEKVTLPNNTLRCKFMGVILPEGYKADPQGVHKRYASQTRFGWKRISTVPCVLSAISEDTEGSICSRVEITFADGTARNAYKIWVDTATAFSPGIATLLRKNGAICTVNDGRRLADYFRECYMLRLQESKQVHCSKAPSIPKQRDDMNCCSRCGEVCTEGLCEYCAQIWKNIDTKGAEL